MKWWFALGVALVPLWVAADPPTPLASLGNGAPATITSDEMELTEHGASTKFIGHVVLTQDPYRVTAKRMVQQRDSGIVELYGSVHGTWHSIAKQDRVEAEGERARYIPSTKVLELWDHAKVTHWETQQDTQPVVVTAEHFIANEPQKSIWAKVNVHAVQATRADVRAPEALYHTDTQILELGGAGRVFIHINDGRGQGDFISDKGWLSLDPRHAKLIDNVQGHVIPAPK